MAATTPLNPGNSADDEEHLFTLCGVKTKITASKLCEVNANTPERRMFDANSDGKLSRKEWTAYMKWSLQKASENQESRPAVNFGRLLLLCALTTLGLYTCYTLTIGQEIAAYDGVDAIGDFSYQYTPPGVTCEGMNPSQGDAYARVGNLNVNRGDAKKGYYGTTTAGIADTSHDIIRLQFYEGKGAPVAAEGINEVHYFSMPIFSHLYPAYLRALSVGAFVLKLGVGKASATPHEPHHHTPPCNDPALRRPRPVTPPAATC